MADAPKRILVVDDESSITEFVGYALRKEGYEVDVFDNGEDALFMVCDHLPAADPDFEEPETVKE